MEESDKYDVYRRLAEALNDFPEELKDRDIRKAEYEVNAKINELFFKKYGDPMAQAADEAANDPDAMRMYIERQ